jgi:hypothetical protein
MKVVSHYLRNSAWCGSPENTRCRVRRGTRHTSTQCPSSFPASDRQHTVSVVLIYFEVKIPRQHRVTHQNAFYLYSPSLVQADCAMLFMEQRRLCNQAFLYATVSCCHNSQ